MASVGIDSVITTNSSKNKHSDVSLEDDSPPALQQLIEALERLLDSKSEPVRVGAAVVMYALGAGNTEVAFMTTIVQHYDYLHCRQRKYY